MNTLLIRSLVRFSAASLLALVVAAPLPAQDQPTGKVHVMVFSDTNLNGIMDPAEQPAGSESVLLYRVEEDGKRTLVQTCKTDEGGQCVFNDVPYGQYVVVYELSTGVAIETLPFAVSQDRAEVFVRPAPLLPKGRRIGFSLFDLGFRNPANALGDAVSRFAPNP